MGRGDWFRNTTWNAEVEANFRQRLSRARDKSQYLRIQASCLAESHPTVALGLLDDYFALGEHFDLAQAHVDRAQALLTLGDYEAALASYEAALDRERHVPNVQTQANLDFAWLVVKARAADRYARALDVLDAYQGSLIFPKDRYRAHGVRALLLEQLGRNDEAKAAARLATAAARESTSGFRYHPHVGLVDNTNDDFGRRVAALAS